MDIIWLPSKRLPWETFFEDWQRGRGELAGRSCLKQALDMDRLAEKLADLIWAGPQQYAKGRHVLMLSNSSLLSTNPMMSCSSSGGSVQMERLKAAGRAFVGKIPPLAWLETYWLWSMFVKYRKHAARKYQHFVEGVTWDSPENPGKDLIGAKLPGSTELVDRAKSTFLYKTGAMEKHHSLQALPEVSIGLVIKGSPQKIHGVTRYTSPMNTSGALNIQVRIQL